jgi:hypothetical protein
MEPDLVFTPCMQQLNMPATDVFARVVLSSNFSVQNDADEPRHRLNLLSEMTHDLQ